MKYEIICTASERKRFISVILPSLIKHLKLERSKKMLVVTLQKDCADEGLTYFLDSVNTFFIVLNSKISFYQLGITLAHEMVHVHQISSGKLKLKSGRRIWNGKVFKSETQYIDQPWELAAFSKQEILFRKSLKTVYT